MKLPSEQSGSSLSRGDPCLGPLCDTLELKGCLSETTRPEGLHAIGAIISLYISI